MGTIEKLIRFYEKIDDELEQSPPPPEIKPKEETLVKPTYQPIIIRGSFFEEEEKDIFNVTYSNNLNEIDHDEVDKKNIDTSNLNEESHELDELDFDELYFNEDIEDYEKFSSKNKDNPIKKDEGNFGVFLYQAILATIIAITYTVVATVFSPVSENFLMTIKSLSTNDFSFSETVYNSVGTFFTYINEQRPLELNAQIWGNSSYVDVNESTEISTFEEIQTDNQVEQEESSQSTIVEDIVDENIQENDIYEFEPEISNDIETETEIEIESEPEAIETSSIIKEVPSNATLTPILFAGDITFPINDYYYISSGYGFRINPITNVDEFHTAYDLAANEGVNILSVLDGTVIDSRIGTQLGNFITIDHGSGLTSVYGHCHELLVKSGDTVKQGDIIATVGTTGLSTGNHLHFGMKMNDIYIDPSYIFSELKIYAEPEIEVN